MSDSDKKKVETIAVSAGRMSREHFGVVNTPVYRASTILYRDLASLDARDVPYTYGRRGTPTSRSLEAARSTASRMSGTLKVRVTRSYER